MRWHTQTPALSHKPSRSDLIELINGPLSKNDRKRLITLCTVDVHARDVVQRLIDDRVESGSCFQWSSQLRYYQHEKTKECQVGRRCRRAKLGRHLPPAAPLIAFPAARCPSAGGHLRRQHRLFVRVHRQPRLPVHHAPD